MSTKIPRNCTFLWTPKDKLRIDKLKKLLEIGQQDVIRMAIKTLAEKHGIA